MEDINRYDSPLTLTNLKRIDDEDAALIHSEFSLGKKITLQFSNSNISEALLEEINALCFKYGERFEVGFGELGHCPVVDLKALEKIPHSQSLYIHHVYDIENLESLSHLTEIKNLTIGTQKLKYRNFLELPNLRNLHSLSLESSFSKALNLAPLENHKKLKSLKNHGHKKNIEALAGLEALEELDLEYVKNPSLSCLNKLKKLKKLVYRIGSKENFNELENESLEHLDIIYVRGFNEIGDIARFPQLKTLSIEQQCQLQSINFTSKHTQLETLEIKICENLSQLNNLENLINLKKLYLSASKIDFDALFAQVQKSKITNFDFFGGCNHEKNLKKIFDSGYLSKEYGCIFMDS